MKDIEYIRIKRKAMWIKIKNGYTNRYYLNKYKELTKIISHYERERLLLGNTSL